MFAFNCKDDERLRRDEEDFSVPRIGLRRNNCFRIFEGQSGEWFLVGHTNLGSYSVVYNNSLIGCNRYFAEERAV